MACEQKAFAASERSIGQGLRPQHPRESLRSSRFASRSSIGQGLRPRHPGESLRSSRFASRSSIGLGLIAGTMIVACKGPMAKIESLRDALVVDDAKAITSATVDLPKCPDMPFVAVAPGKPGPRDSGCLSDI